MDNLLAQKLIEIVTAHVNPLAIILYGSYAKAQFGALSDYDLAVIIDDAREDFKHDEIVNDQGLLIDMVTIPLQCVQNFITHTRYEDKLKFKQFYRGKALMDKNRIGEKLLAKVNDIIQQGPKILSAQEKKSYIQWINKRSIRASSDELVYRYRRVELITKLLESYFELRDLWFLGVKSSFEYLEQHDPKVYYAFESVLVKNNHEIQSLVSLIIREPEF